MSSPAAEFSTLGGRILDNIGAVLDGKPEAARMALIALLAEGHLLIEDVPGVGKTVLARALAASVECSVRRIQFTPDLLPSDITGVSVFNRAEGSFEFQPGAIFAHLVIADEINRSSPKTQSALLEAMEERQVTIDGQTHPLPRPFTVVATQNPLDMEGTHALPEAQRDRFMMRIAMGYPDAEAEREMLARRESHNPLDTLRPVISRAELSELITRGRNIYVSPLVERYAVALVRATRTHPDLRLGASPRATLQLVRAAKVHAGLDGREFILPDDIVALLVPVLAHRLVPLPRVLTEQDPSGARAITEILRSILATVAVPRAGSVRP
ncbi:AAA family ATPase [Mycetocola spongiae]|uniref:AAA family ATPase n=1 Tax=Mycetocola spongiae TaxID=2859226 RepID=UPI001CF14DAE|nr:MoxR family ATPase [Mycetocola spongiae]UCR88219.1 AAA family ATPase [Mycetocola spongiae]